MEYAITKTPKRYNVTGKDTYRVLKKLKTPLKGFNETWEIVEEIDISFDTLEEAENALSKIKKKGDKVTYKEW